MSEVMSKGAMSELNQLAVDAQSLSARAKGALQEALDAENRLATKLEQERISSMLRRVLSDCDCGRVCDKCMFTRRLIDLIEED